MRFPLFPPFYERTCVRGDTQLYDYLAETHKSVPSLGYIYSLDLLPLIWRMVVAAAAARQTDNYKIINVERTHIIVSELIATFTWTWVCGRGRRKGGACGRMERTNSPAPLAKCATDSCCSNNTQLWPHN